MDRMKAHGHFMALMLAGKEDRNLFDTNPRERWAAMGTALANLSGRLDECGTLRDLYDAARHGLELLGMGALTIENVKQEADDIIRDVLRWGDAHRYN